MELPFCLEEGIEMALFQETSPPPLTQERSRNPTIKAGGVTKAVGVVVVNKAVDDDSRRCMM